MRMARQEGVWNMPLIFKAEKDIPFHRAFSDAYYTAGVLANLPEKHWKIIP